MRQTDLVAFRQVDTRNQPILEGMPNALIIEVDVVAPFSWR